MDEAIRLVQQQVDWMKEYQLEEEPKITQGEWRILEAERILRMLKYHQREMTFLA